MLSKGTLSKFTTGRVIDLMSNDVQRLEEDSVSLFFSATFAIFELVAVMVLLPVFVGWQGVMGVIFLCFLLPYFLCLSHAASTLRLRTADKSDRRIALMNEVVSGIRAIKTHAWEKEYREKIKNSRR